MTGSGRLGAFCIVVREACKAAFKAASEGTMLRLFV